MKTVIFLISFIAYTYALIDAQVSQGFFLDDFSKKNAKIPESKPVDLQNLEPDISISIDASDTITRVSKYVYGNNANIYMTQMVNQPKLLNLIKTLSPNVIRFPGGNISNAYFWDKEKNDRPDDIPDSIFVDDGKKVENVWFGKNDTDYTVTLDNYYKMLEITNNTGVICVNVGYSRYGTSENPINQAAHYAANWVRYDNGRTKFWEIGNENYGPWVAGFKIDTNLNKDGQPEIISGKLYGKISKVFADSMRAAAKEIGSEIKLGVVIIEAKRDSNWYNPVEADWNRGYFNAAGNYADFFIIHSYFTPYDKDSKADVILESPLHEAPKMMEYLIDMCKEFNVEMKPVALTEWNIFALKSKQATSYINGMHATLVLGELIKNKYGMGNRWNLANGWEEGNDHGMLSKGDESGVPLWTPRPPFHYMYYFQQYFGNYMIKTDESTNDDIICYASLFDSGEAGLAVINKGKKEMNISIEVENYELGDNYYYHSLIGGDDHPEFSLNVVINGQKSEEKVGGPNVLEVPAYSADTKNGIIIPSPAYSVQYILINNKK
ncbi:alpha-L-arabinofuranosidase [Bacteroidota bacterium]